MRTLTALAATGLLAPVILHTPAPAAHADDCPDIEVVFARGTTEPLGLGRVGAAFVNDLRARLDVSRSAAQLTRFLQASVELMAVLARACGHARLGDLSVEDLTTFDRDLHHLAGVPYGGLHP